MSAADCKASRRKILLRYGRPGKRDVGTIIAAERQKAARQAAAAKKKK